MYSGPPYNGGGYGHSSHPPQPDNSADRNTNNLNQTPQPSAYPAPPPLGQQYHQHPVPQHTYYNLQQHQQPPIPNHQLPNNYLQRFPAPSQQMPQPLQQQQQQQYYQQRTDYQRFDLPQPPQQQQSPNYQHRRDLPQPPAPQSPQLYFPSPTPQQQSRGYRQLPSPVLASPEAAPPLLAGYGQVDPQAARILRPQLSNQNLSGLPSPVPPRRGETAAISAVPSRSDSQLHAETVQSRRPISRQTSSSSIGSHSGGRRTAPSSSPLSPRASLSPTSAPVSPRASQILSTKSGSPRPRSSEVRPPATSTHSRAFSPALLSQVAEAFRARITLGTHTKDYVEYTDCFSGREAVDLLAEIIRSPTDRSLAVQIGCALHAQELFHDVTYLHRLRDSQNELYKFPQTYLAFPTPGEPTPDEDSAAGDGGDDWVRPVGVFTLLTACYSSSCTPENLCYSSSCPRRMEQQARLIKVGHSTLEATSSVYLKEKDISSGENWTNSVPPEISASLSKDERKRQEVLFEVVKSEGIFAEDLEVLASVYRDGIKESAVTPSGGLERFVADVFSNFEEIKKISSKLLARLKERQRKSPIIEKIGDVFVGIVDEFEKPYPEYAGRQPAAKQRVDQEKQGNPAFAQLMSSLQSRPETRKLPLENFLGTPTLRLGRYPLLLEEALKHTPESHPDRVLIPRAVAILKAILQRVNAASGKATDLITRTKLSQQILFGSDGDNNLNLLDESRTCVRQGALTYKGTEAYVFLFDNMLLITKSKHNQYKPLRKPIPLQTLSISSERPPGSLDVGYSFHLTTHVPPSATFTLAAPEESGRTSWMEALSAAIMKRTSAYRRFDLLATVSSGVPRSTELRITCSTVHDGRLILGTESGVVIGPVGSADREAAAWSGFRNVLSLEKVSQIDVLAEFNLVVVLA
ncbi:hypothetical protein BDK51DRAFT_27601, partial [Blyttiomyces helicus]